VTGELILYTTEDGQSRIQLRAQGGTVWVTQAEIAELFQTTPQNITLHIKAIYAERELLAEATCKEHLQVREEGKRQVKRALKHYNLDVVLAVGYRVRSHRGTQFRQWATTNLRQYLMKGFVVDDERLKDPSGRDYFDELLERIREIRASEKRFYQKIREIYATAVDYDAKGELAKLFFKKVQNKMLGGVISGDKVRATWGACKCGNHSPSIDQDIQRYADIASGDKIACSGTIDAYVRGGA
jgi:hypothetical protein